MLRTYIDTGRFQSDIDPVRTDNLYAFFEELLPPIASRSDKATAKNWAGLRPMSYDGKPFIGPTVIPGLYVNSAHGPLGCALPMGSAHVLTDILIGDKPPVDPTTKKCDYCMSEVAIEAKRCAFCTSELAAAS